VAVKASVSAIADDTRKQAQHEVITMTDTIVEALIGYFARNMRSCQYIIQNLESVFVLPDIYISRTILPFHFINNKGD